MVFGILEKALAGVCAVLLIALIGFGVYHKVTVSLLESKVGSQAKTIGTLQPENAALTAANVNLKGSVDKQNDYIDKLTKAQEEATAAARRALEKAQEEGAKWRKKYSDIINAPKPNPDSCIAISLKLDQYLTVRAEEARK